MRKPQTLQIFKALLLSSFVIFALGFNHVSLNQRSMNGMEGMSDHSGMSSIQCQILCTTATKSDELTNLFNHEQNDKEPLPAIGFALAISLSALALSFIVKRLHLLSSARPPDRTLLYGHYSDGL